jgi:cation:H+ antiporter
MSTFTHILLFLLSAGVIWFFAGMLVDAIDRVAKRFNQSGFTVAFFVLGFLTSISEISVMVNSTIDKVPQISAGNLSGASFVILMLVVPFLAISGNGVLLRNTLTRKHLAIALFVISLPTLFLLDGRASWSEGLICLLVYGSLLYFIRQHNTHSIPQIIEEVEEELVDKDQTIFIDSLKILGGALFIFLAGHLLVQEAVYFSEIMSVPSSIIGLLLLSIGTNVPELVIAFRSILKGRKDIAFGDYLGSTLANTATFGVLAISNSSFNVEENEFLFTAILMIIGFTMFYIFATSKNKITRKEGFYLAGIYAIFVLVQFATLIKFATD